MMYTLRHIALMAAMLLALALPNPAAAAECYADYKAKKDSPLRLHYGVMQLHQGCSKADAKKEVAARIKGDGWKLLNVLSVFDGSELAGKESSAGQFYLRY
ncbi:hypothetical protein ACS3QZ_16425 [Shimia sp. W99]|uniref:DUF4177 domain-containing protein n=1 Tax=Shimia aestuarii TaxID=254406 RepID=A0A1I4MLR4_9RHOB|nr:hypothetical protein [Shimia aestuarii]SFM04204.1 hypothetical protein SAMN04488042_103147 [Shimia aestuarii]